MATKKKKLTPLQQAYSKELDRLKRAVKKAEKNGFEIDKEMLPKTPKRITKQSLSKIKSMKNDVVYNWERVNEPETKEPEPKEPEAETKEPQPKHDREKYNQKQHKKQQEQTKEDYPKFSDMVISNFYVDISHFPSMAEPMLRSWIGELINQYGRDDVAEMLENAKASGIWISYQIAYSKDLLLGMISDMMDYLPDASDWFKKDLAEKFEFDEDWESPD